MTDEELQPLLADLESDRVERKASLADLDEVRKAICAFANDLPGHGQPGVVFVGVQDDGAAAGIAITDDLLLKLSQLRDDGLIQPLPSISVSKRCWSGAELAVVVVAPAVAPPVRLRGRTWVRVGPRTVTASAEDERRLVERRHAKDLPFDLHPLPSASVADLDLVLFERAYLPAAVDPEVLALNDRTLEEKLRALRFLTPDDLPTVLGMLVLGKDTRRLLPGAYIQFVRFEGVELTDAIRDQKEIAGAMPDQLNRMDDVLEANNAVAAAITNGPLEVRRAEYALPALQQLARNAVLHRNYEGTNAPIRIHWFADRIEISSPGGPFGQVSRENFGRPGLTDYRNPHLGEAMKVLGYVQRFGLGIPIARQELARNGNPPPEFEVEATQVRVTVRRGALV